MSPRHAYQPGVTNAADQVNRFVAAMSAHPMPDLIANLDTQVSQVACGGQHFPITLNTRGQRGNCYICNPVTAYINYALDELRNFPNRGVRSAIAGLIRAAAPLVRASGLDHQVQVNNWLFSTNPVPALDAVAATALRDALLARYPDRAIFLRSLNDMADGPTIRALLAAGFVMLPARQVYLVPAALPRLPNNLRHDFRALRNTAYQLVGPDDITEADYPRGTALYEMLYIRKYTPLNPQYTARWLAQMRQAGLIELAGLRRRTPPYDLVAITGFFQNGNTLTQPLVGYDTDLPQRDALYRMVMAIGQRMAQERGLFFNVSAGAGAFKRLRGAVPAIEYSAAYVGHLPRRQRLATGAMASLLTRIGVPLLQRYEL